MRAGTINVWSALERQPFFVALVDAIATFLGTDARSALELPFSLNTAEELRKLAQDARLRNIRVRFEHRTTRYPTAAGLVTGLWARRRLLHNSWHYRMSV